MRTDGSRASPVRTARSRSTTPTTAATGSRRSVTRSPERKSISTDDDAGRLHRSPPGPVGVNGTFTYDAAGRLTRMPRAPSSWHVNGHGGRRQPGYAVNFTALFIDPSTLLVPAMPTFTYDAAHQVKNTGNCLKRAGDVQTAFSPRPFPIRQDGASNGWSGLTAMARYLQRLVNDIETRTVAWRCTHALAFCNHAFGTDTRALAERNENTLQVQRYYGADARRANGFIWLTLTSGNAVRFFRLRPRRFFATVLTACR